MVTGAVTAPVVAHIGTNRKLDSLGSGMSLARFQILARELEARAQYLAVRPWTALVSVDRHYTKVILRQQLKLTYKKYDAVSS